MESTSRPAVFDPLLGFLEAFIVTHSGEIIAQREAVKATIWSSVRDGAYTARSRSAQFKLLREGVAQAHEVFRTTSEGVSKETLMGIARRSPDINMNGAYLTLARMIVKYAASKPMMSFEVAGTGAHDLGLVFSGDDVFVAFRLMTLAEVVFELEVMARYIGKGARLKILENGELRLETPDNVSAAVREYERRRPRGSLFDSNGFFLRQPEPKQWSDLRMPVLHKLDPAQYFEAPIGSQRWLYFERWPSMLDAAGLARLLRGYDEAIRESWGVGADTILHFLTALSVLIYYSSPTPSSLSIAPAFQAEVSAEVFEQKIGFAFGLARKGFLRLPRESFITDLGRVRNSLAPDEETGKRLAAEFVAAFLLRLDQIERFDFPPFLHTSTGDYLYVDILLLWDFLAGVLEQAKQWYASQHGDHFLLDLKRWLDVEVPGFVVEAKRPVRLSRGTSDIDLLARGRTELFVIECKAYGKSAEYMAGAPEAVASRHGLIQRAVRQANRTAQQFASSVASGKTEFPTDTRVTPVVCMPSVEFLSPLEEFGIVGDGFPRVLTPEELLELGVMMRA